jgi:multicomponent Na+:H+ antiporter subunit E
MSSLTRILRTRAFWLHWLTLFLFWFVLSGSLKAFYLAMGLLCSGGVALLTYDLQFSEPAHERDRRQHFGGLPWLGLWLYAFWLLKEVAVANWQVVKIVLAPRLSIDPAMIRFETRLDSSLARTLLANSITLTPGTITIDIQGDEFLVHALVADQSAVEGITAMQNRIAAVLSELEDPQEVVR